MEVAIAIYFLRGVIAILVLPSSCAQLVSLKRFAGIPICSACRGYASLFCRALIFFGRAKEEYCRYSGCVFSVGFTTRCPLWHQHAHINWHVKVPGGDSGLSSAPVAGCLQLQEVLVIEQLRRVKKVPRVSTRVVWVDMSCVMAGRDSAGWFGLGLPGKSCWLCDMSMHVWDMSH